MNATDLALEGRLERTEKALAALIAAVDHLKSDNRGRAIGVSGAHISALEEAASAMGITLPPSTGIAYFADLATPLS